ncbi:MAG: TIGR03960 family B12-binding radical SAM protein [Candidatus Sumerlaeia bacterium]
MTSVDWTQIEPLLMQVLKPARYIGGEFNTAVKPAARARACLAFPDLYEIGMSYHGFRILYERINAREGWAAERAFAPWTDMEKLMRERGLPLWSLETRTPLREFDWIGFTLQHEVNLTNVLTMLDLAGLPLEARERTEALPLIVGGGEGAYSPEAIAPFMDVLVVGDGEEAVLELMETCGRAREENWDRRRLLMALAARPGFYVPEFYEPKYNEDGTVESVRAEDGAPSVVSKRHYALAGDLGSTKPIVPLMRTVHDRLSIEIRRGCVGGCRFCQAGMINRPVSERPVGQIVEIARRGIEATGYSELALLSLSAADYSRIAPLIDTLTERFGPRGVSVALPSLRINAFDVDLADGLAKVRRSGFTFAPEAGTTRLRNVINKPLDQEKFIELIDDVWRRGWRTIKFYFMIGLPTETDEDLDGIVQICQEAIRSGRRRHGKQARLNVTLSPFVPRANTPFQWEAQMPREELWRRYDHVRQRLRGVDVKVGDIDLAFIEATLARADRRMGKALRRAWELGARFEGWQEKFRFDVWMRAFEECGIDPAFYANRGRGEFETLPYEHVDCGVGRRFLWVENRRGHEGRTVENCDTGKCAGCKVCGDGVEHALAKDMEPFHAAAAETVPPEGGTTNGLLPIQRLRIRYSRLEGLRFISHLDFLKILHAIIKRSCLPLAWSQGFNPQPRLQHGPPLSLGMGGENEVFDMMMARPVEAAEALERLRAGAIPGLAFASCEEVPLKADSVEASLSHASYRLTLNDGENGAEALGRFAAAGEFPIRIQRKNGERNVDLKQSVRIVPPEGGAANGAGIGMTISLAQGEFVKPHEALGAMMGRELVLGVDVHVDRTGFMFARTCTDGHGPARTDTD